MYLRTFLLRNLMCCYTETEVANQTAMKPGGKTRKEHERKARLYAVCYRRVKRAV